MPPDIDLDIELDTCWGLRMRAESAIALGRCLRFEHVSLRVKYRVIDITLGAAVHKERSPTVFTLKFGTFRGVLDDRNV